MSVPRKNLNNTITQLPDPPELPRALPITHLSYARWFDVIARSGYLKPTFCKTFGENLIYLFYGGVFYRPHNKPTRNVAELPIAFLFSPRVLKRILRYYPFDTGGIATGRFGIWSTSLGPSINNFKVNGNRNYNLPRKLVYHIFNSNESYLYGHPDPNCKNKPEPLPQLFDFYSDDLTSIGVDHRQCVIECQSRKPLPMKDDLLWVGFPESMTGEFLEICKLTAPFVPQFFAYKSHSIIIPSEITAKLEEIAKQQVIERFANLP